MGEKLQKPINCFYKEGKACVREGKIEEEHFSVKVGLRDVLCWLFNIFVNGEGRELKTRVRRQRQEQCIVLGENGTK